MSWAQVAFFIGLGVWGMIGLLGFIAMLYFLRRPLAVLGRTLWSIIKGPFIYLTFPFVRWLAKRRIFFFSMKPGTLSIIHRGADSEKGPRTGEKIFSKGDFARVLINWANQTVSQKRGFDVNSNPIDVWDCVPDGAMIYDRDSAGNLVNGEPQRERVHAYGGIRSFLWPFERPMSYEFQWTGFDAQNSQPQAHAPQVLDHVYARRDSFYFEVFDQEDLEDLPLYVSGIVWLRVVNARKALQDVENWLEATLNRILSLVRREYVARNAYADLKKADVNAEVWQELTQRGVVVEVREQFGVIIEAIEFLQIEPPEDRRSSTLRTWEEAREADAQVRRAKGDVERTRLWDWLTIIKRKLLDK